MSSPEDQTAAPPTFRPTVFISYASEDRVAARLLRDELTASGLDVWYDENELSGGDAWDQKIRRQIRDCEYFMPLVSANTEARKEGYFRREWRLATDRSLDMADDVLFLIPVTIDGTSEFGARVPEKFLTVQWLRLPGGQPTPALHHLIRRILSGDHHALTRPPMAFNRPPMAAAAAASKGEPPPLKPPPSGPEVHEDPRPIPPMPPFPPVPEKGGFFHGVKFLAEVLWWALTASRMLFVRAPKWVRILILIWLVTTLFSFRCSRNSDSGTDRSPAVQLTAPEKTKARLAIKDAAEKIAQATQGGEKTTADGSFAKLGSDLARGFAAGLQDEVAANKQLVVVPFSLGVTHETEAGFLNAVFNPLYGRLAVARVGDTGLVTEKPTLSDVGLVEAGHKLNAGYVLGAWVKKVEGTSNLTVRLIKVADGSVAWSGDYPVADSEPATISDEIATGVLAAVSQK